MNRNVLEFARTGLLSAVVTTSVLLPARVLQQRHASAPVALPAQSEKLHVEAVGPQELTATMGIAVDKQIAKENQREGEPTADFFNIVAWRHSAEFASNYLNKGRLVAVDGRLQQRTWVDPQGQKRSVVEIVADKLQGLDRREDGQGAPPAGGRPAPAGQAAPPVDDFAGDDYDPFADQ